MGSAGCDSTATEAEPPRPASLQIQPESLRFASLGESAALTATVRDQNGSLLNEASVTWSTADAAVVAVDAQGVVVATGNGSATITATTEGVSASISVVVEQELVSVVILPDTHRFSFVGETALFAVEARDARDNAMPHGPVSWFSSDASVAIVDDGTVTAVAPGLATIAVLVDGLGAEATVEVEQEPVEIQVDPTSLSFDALDATLQVTATVLDGGGTPTGGSVQWSTDDPAVATVDGMGAVTAVGNGSTQIRATAGSLTAGIAVDVRQRAASVTLQPTSHTFGAMGATRQFSAMVVDPGGTPVTDLPVSWASANPSIVSIDGAGLATARAPGATTVSATVQTTTGTASVSVPHPTPSGEIALLDSGNQLHIVQFNGSNRRMPGFGAPSVREPSLDWSRDGRRIAVGGVTGAVVYDVSANTTVTGAWPAGGGMDVIWPRFGPGGDTIYYSSLVTGNSWDLRKIAADGTGPEIVVAHDTYPRNDFMPTLSPDRRLLVYTADWESHNTFLLRVLDIPTGTTSTIPVEGVTPVWSRDGSWIGFQELGLVGVVRPDGSGLKTWNPGWSKGVTFSPDGRWLVGLRSGVVEALEIATGRVLSYSSLGSGYRAVAWRP